MIIILELLCKLDRKIDSITSALMSAQSYEYSYSSRNETIKLGEQLKELRAQKDDIIRKVLDKKDVKLNEIVINGDTYDFGELMDILLRAGYEPNVKVEIRANEIEQYNINF